MIKREITVGFIAGLLVNSVGTLLYVLLFSNFGVVETLIVAYRDGFLGSLMALGALLNLILFFVFLKKKKEYRARGVLMATVLVALCILIYKLV
jgi:hypothetical protein